MARGEFDDLPGHGKPLPPDEFSRVPGDLRMGYRLLRNADAVPPELEAHREAARLGPLIAAAGDEEERTRLSRLRADAEMRYQLLVERRRR
jgi:hypothetical protein